MEDRHRADSPRQRIGRLLTPVQDFMHDEAAGGVVLVVATAIALVWATVARASYDGLWHSEVRLGIGELAISLDLQHWVNDALMALFFFVVGIEIKRELVTGELRDRRAAALPVIAALGGVIVPAALFLLIVGGGTAARGWGIPMATDIAFAVGVMALLGDRVPPAAKVFLLSLAIVDDIIAIGVIAIAYSGDTRTEWLIAAVLGLGLVAAAWRFGRSTWWIHVPLALLVWLAVFSSGVHATIAGVALGLLVPARPVRGREVLRQLEHRLHPISAFGVVPLFALANAGVALRGDVIGAAISSSLTWAIVVGLVVGKTVGITGAVLLAVRTGLTRLPTGTTFRTIVGLAALGGIGFTVSLFIAGLAYEDPAIVEQAKIGILGASTLAAALGVLLLVMAARRDTPAKDA